MTTREEVKWFLVGTVVLIFLSALAGVSLWWIIGALLGLAALWLAFKFLAWITKTDISGK